MKSKGTIGKNLTPKKGGRPRKQGRYREGDWKLPFLQALCRTGNVSFSAAAAKVSRRQMGRSTSGSQMVPNAQYHTGVPEDVARERAEACTREYLDRLAWTETG